MKRSIFKILFVLCVLNIAACQNSNPTIFIENVKVVGSLHEDLKVEMFLDCPLQSRQLMSLDGANLKIGYPKGDEILATVFKPACFQNQRIVEWYKRLIIEPGGDPDTFDSPSFSEDCLHLNLWRPLGAQENLPVVVLFMGAAIIGWSYEPNYLGHNIADKGFILISIPYRLGVFFGFLTLKLKILI